MPRVRSHLTHKPSLVVPLCFARHLVALSDESDRTRPGSLLRMCCYILAASAWFAGQAYYAYYLGKLFSDSRVSLTDEEKQVYEDYFKESLSMGDFQTFIRMGSLSTSESRIAVVKADQQEPPLVFVVDGQPEIELYSGVSLTGRPGLFGEAPFLAQVGEAQQETIYVPAGCRYITWETRVLRKHLEESPRTKAAIEKEASRGLASKILDTNRELINRARLAEYREAVLECLLQTIVARGARQGCGGFFHELSLCRERLGVSDELHAHVLQGLGLDKDEALCGNMSLRDVAQLLGARFKERLDDKQSASQ